LVHYNGKSEIYRQLHEGTYTYEEFDNMLVENDWIGSYPLYAYEEYPTQNTEETKPSSTGITTTHENVDWEKHNNEVLKRLKKHKEQEEMLQAFTEE
jgi:hypothetical protein